jgi:hypothetical protein
MNFELMLFWHWWVAGLVLMTLEAFLPGAIFLWMGVSAFIVGLLAWIIPSLGWQGEFVLFAALSVIAVLAWRKYRPLPTSDSPTLNRRGESYVGRQFTLMDPVVNGVGKLRVDDSQWRISGPDMPAGSRVRVTRADGATLHVDPSP